jgi:hypothetical protein
MSVALSYINVTLDTVSMTFYRLCPRLGIAIVTSLKPKHHLFTSCYSLSDIGVQKLRLSVFLMFIYRSVDYVCLIYFFYTFDTVYYNILLQETNQHDAQFSIYSFTSLHVHVSVSVDHLPGACSYRVQRLKHNMLTSKI